MTGTSQSPKGVNRWWSTAAHATEGVKSMPCPLVQASREQDTSSSGRSGEQPRWVGGCSGAHVPLLPQLPCTRGDFDAAYHWRLLVRAFL